MVLLLNSSHYYDSVLYKESSKPHLGYNVFFGRTENSKNSSLIKTMG